jgi:hypothetical protein
MMMESFYPYPNKCMRTFAKKLMKWGPKKSLLKKTYLEKKFFRIKDQSWFSSKNLKSKAKKILWILKAMLIAIISYSKKVKKILLFKFCKKHGNMTERIKNSILVVVFIVMNKKSLGR